MEDVILVKSQQYNAKKGFLITLTVILSLMLLVCVITAIELYAERYEESLAIFKNHSCEGEDHWCKEYSSAQEYAIGCALDFAANCWFRSYGIAGSPVKIVILSLLALSLILGFIGFLWMKSYEMVVTDKRVYGKVAFGKRVDLPNDFISAIAMVPIL